MILVWSNLILAQEVGFTFLGVPAQQEIRLIVLSHKVETESYVLVKELHKFAEEFLNFKVQGVIWRTALHLVGVVVFAFHEHFVCESWEEDAILVSVVYCLDFAAKLVELARALMPVGSYWTSVVHGIVLLRINHKLPAKWDFAIYSACVLPPDENGWNCTWFGSSFVSDDVLAVENITRAEGP